MIYRGNAGVDAPIEGWFFGNRQPPGPRHHKNVFLKYGVHLEGDQCKNPYTPSDKFSISILIDGGPFVHSFKNADGTDLPTEILERVGDYVIYGTDVLHTWTATKQSTIISVQFPDSTE